MTPTPVSTLRFVCWFIVWTLGCGLWVAGDEFTAWTGGMLLMTGSGVLLTTWEEMNRPVIVSARRKAAGLLLICIGMLVVPLAFSLRFPGWRGAGGKLAFVTRHPALVLSLWAWVVWRRWQWWHRSPLKPLGTA